MKGKAQAAQWYRYRQRLATPPFAGKAANPYGSPKGWAGKWPFTALWRLAITGYCLRTRACA